MRRAFAIGVLVAIVGCGISGKKADDMDCSMSCETCDHVEVRCSSKGGDAPSVELGGVPVPGVIR